MANRAGRRQFGWVRQLPSGRYQASYVGPDGVRRLAPKTYPTGGGVVTGAAAAATGQLKKCFAG
jgi:hypothetical protein